MGDLAIIYMYLILMAVAWLGIVAFTLRLLGRNNPSAR